MFNLILLVPGGVLTLFLITLGIFGLYRICGGKKSYCQFWR